MPTISIATFGGEVPRTTPRLLENTQASVCVNCDLTRGALQALRGPGVVQDCPQGTRTIFKHDVDGWLAWPNVVNVVKSAVLDIDGDTPLGHLFLTGERDYPTQYLSGGIVRRLGIPRPATAPAVAVSAGAVAHTVVAYAWGADSAAGFPPRYGYESALPPIQPDTATAGPFGGTGSGATSGTDIGISRSSVYVYTLVQSLAGGVWQQESAPSPASVVVDVPDGDGVMVSGWVIPQLEGLEVTHIRLYRAVSGSESAEFQFLVELPASATSYVDTTHDVDMSGDVLSTTTWDVIPDDAHGLVKTDNGIYAAFRGNELLLSEPFVPYAFPEAYRNTVEDRIVALAHTDNTIIVLTTGRPYLATGSEPESLQYTHLPIEQACVSARSVAMLPGGVIYASPDGLMLFTSNEQALATAATWTHEQWQELHPESLMGVVHDGRYVGFFEGTNRGFLFSLGAKDVVWVELPDGWQVRDVYHHSEDDCVYLAVDTPEGGRIVQCEAGEPLSYRWRSKPFFTSTLTCMSVVRVEAEYGRGAKVNVNVYGPDTRRARERLHVRDNRARRLTTTRSEKLWSIEVKGTTTVYEVRMGNSVEGVEHGQ